MHEPTWFTLRGGSQRAREARRYEGGTGARAVTMASSRDYGVAPVPFRPGLPGRAAHTPPRRAQNRFRVGRPNAGSSPRHNPRRRAAAYLLLRLSCDQVSVAWGEGAPTLPPLRRTSYHSAYWC